MSTFILIHGSWHGGWCWDYFKPMLEVEGHTVLTPTLPGMDYNLKVPPRNVGLTEHVEFIRNLIEENNLHDLILVGHSYGGMVITGVSLLIPERIKKLVYLDAFLPNSGESLFDISAPERVELMKKSLVDEENKTLEEGGNDPYLLPVRDPVFFGIKDIEMTERIKDKLVRTSVKTFTDKIGLGTISEDIEKHYIRCMEFPVSERFEAKAKEMGYACYQLNTGHDVMLIDPKLLFDLIVEISKN
jgi:pimeloyl-ACP methyl ester carboxylesterase